MDHKDHVALLREAVAGSGPHWADLGSGEGAFTLALADLLGAGASIDSVDLDRGALRAQRRALEAHFPGIAVRYHVADFTHELPLPPGALDGLLMANSLHFVQAKDAALPHLLGLLKPGGRFVLVEYDTDAGNRWVPYPLSFASWEALAGRFGLIGTRRTGRIPSRFLGSMFSALSVLPGIGKRPGSGLRAPSGGNVPS